MGDFSNFAASSKAPALISIPAPAADACISTNGNGIGHVNHMSPPHRAKRGARSLGESRLGPFRHGFTLVELLITVLVAAILLTLAVPELSAIIHKNRIRATTSDLYASMNLARSEAIKRRNSVRVCPSADGSSCRNDGDWSDGWIVFDNADGSGTPATSEIISRVSSVHPRVDLSCDAAVEDYVQFNPTGDAFGTSGEYHICHQDTRAKSFAVTVSPGGQLAESERNDTACVAE